MPIWQVMGIKSVTVHQAQRVNLPAGSAGFGTRLSQRADEPPPVLPVPEDGLAPVAAIHHVVDRARIFDSELSRHAPKAAQPSVICQYQEPTRMALS